MELMSSVLLCALLTLLPQALGEHRIFTSSFTSNDSAALRKYAKGNPFLQKKLFLNSNVLSPIKKKSALQSLFLDANCQPCTACMAKAIKSLGKHQHIPSKEELHYDIMGEEQDTAQYRYKRDDNYAMRTKKPKLKKVKRSQTQKSVTVTKYTRDREVYALRVQEMETKNNTCELYRVRRAYACNSHEGDLIMALAKKKSKKASKRDTEKASSTVTTTETVVVTTKKQNAESGHVSQDSFLPSIEVY